MLHGLPALDAYHLALDTRAQETLDDILAEEGDAFYDQACGKHRKTSERLAAFRAAMEIGAKASINGGSALPAAYLFSYDEGSEDLIIFGQRIYADYRRAIVEPDGTMTLSWVRGSLNLRLM